MESITYRLDQFEGPLDLLLTLIHKNKVNIEDIPIALICDQYMQYITEAQKMDMEIASEFIVMASDLMLIKSKLLLPREKEDEEDPRKQLTDTLLRYQQAKEAASIMHPLYALFSGRQIKDTDEISVDRTFVADQDAEKLYVAMKRIVDFNDALDNAQKNAFTPMIAKPIVPVEHKILQIMTRLTTNRYQTLEDFVSDSISLPDMIAIFLGVLELIKIRKILIHDCEGTLLDMDATFVVNQEQVASDDDQDTSTNNNEGGQNT